MHTKPSGRRLFTFSLLCLALAASPTFAANSAFTLLGAAPKTLTPAAAKASEKTDTQGVLSSDKKTLTFRRKTIRLVAHTGPEDDMLSYRIAGKRNPTLVIPKGATLKILFINTDDDMLHNLRFGAWHAKWPNVADPLLKTSVGTRALPHKTETALHAEELTIRAPLTAGKYAYFCTVRGHAQGGMWGTVSVR